MVAGSDFGDVDGDGNGDDDVDDDDAFEGKFTTHLQRKLGKIEDGKVTPY